jgi:hypothetical protein
MMSVVMIVYETFLKEKKNPLVGKTKGSSNHSFQPARLIAM